MFCKHANWIMLFLCIQFATCPLPRLFFKQSHTQNFMRPDPTTTLPWPSLLLVLHPTVGSTPTTLPLQTPTATTIGLAYHHWLFLGPPDFSEAPTWTITVLESANCDTDLLAINSGASIPQSARAYYVLEQLGSVNDIPRYIVLQYIWIEQGA